MQVVVVGVFPLHDPQGLQVRVVVGPATDSAVGATALARVGLDSANVLLEAQRVCALATAGMVPEDTR